MITNFIKESADFVLLLHTTDSTTGTDGYLLPLAIRITLKLVSDGSISSLHWAGSHCIFSSIVNAFEIGQNTNPSSSEKVISGLVICTYKKIFLHLSLRNSTAEV